MPSLKDLRILSENKFVGFPDGKILSWCPTMDLLAVSMNKTSIWVFRLNGQRVFSINNRAEILDLQWNHSGKFFVVAGSDSLMKVYDSNNGKLINLLPTKPGLPITLTSWSYMDVNISIGEEGSFFDLFKVDILKAMPKLSNEVDSLVENGSSVDKDTEARPMSVSVTNTTEGESFLDCLLVVNDNKSLLMTFNNLFTVSDIQLPENCRYLHHATPENMFSQYFLTEHNNMLQIRELKVLVNESLKRHLLEVIEWCAQLVSIINHIRDQVNAIVSESVSFLSVLDRHLGNLKDVLYENVDLTTNFPTPGEVEDKIVETLVDMLLTGLIPISLKDFWLNQFGERGLMKVSAVGNTAYDSARKALFGQIILALEKLIILLGYLESVAVAETNLRQDTLGMSVESIQTAVRLSQDLAKKFYSFIWKLNLEQELFNKFMNWCKVEVIEKLASEDNDAEAFFNLHPIMDFRGSHIVEYLENSLFNSSLLQYLEIKNDFEALTTSQESISTFQDDIEKLHHELNHNLLEGIQQYFVGRIEFSPPLNLDLEPHQDSSSILVSTNINVTSIKENKLTFVSFPDKKKEICFPGKIIAHQYIESLCVLVLYKTGLCYNLDIVDVNESGTYPLIIKSLTFDETTFVKEPAMLAVNSANDSTHIIGCVLDSSKKEYIVFQVN